MKIVMGLGFLFVLTNIVVKQFSAFDFISEYNFKKSEKGHITHLLEYKKQIKKEINYLNYIPIGSSQVKNIFEGFPHLSLPSLTPLDLWILRNKMLAKIKNQNIIFYTGLHDFIRLNPPSYYSYLPTKGLEGAVESLLLIKNVYGWRALKEEIFNIILKEVMPLFESRNELKAMIKSFTGYPIKETKAKKHTWKPLVSDRHLGMLNLQAFINVLKYLRQNGNKVYIFEAKIKESVRVSMKKEISLLKQKIRDISHDHVHLIEHDFKEISDDSFIDDIHIKENIGILVHKKMLSLIQEKYEINIKMNEPNTEKEKI
ncbi:MAG: hypothetical protein QF441_15385 [Bacteriovoracaceae bacterium]|jgi:hypothetical protein|nr:hypothetical protein [Bacteriovoracaceae bacterium]